MALYQTSAGSSSSSVPWTLSLPPKKNVEYVTCRDALAQIKKEMKSCDMVALYRFNVLEDQLEAAYAGLDKLASRRQMRLTYNDDYNFIVKYMSGIPHEVAYGFFWGLLTNQLVAMSGRPYDELGIKHTGKATFEPQRNKKKEADFSMKVRHTTSPTVIIEVGSSETLRQLQIDARIWLESTLYDIQLVIIICIDKPVPPSEVPRIIIEQYKSSPPDRPAPNHRQKKAVCVWHEDWTHGASPDFPLLLSDVYGPERVPEFYGELTEVNFTPESLDAWRMDIVEEFIEES